jgi:peptidoglycan/xylan/chitin deacetylase (PgdA/CDA1 family)
LSAPIPFPERNTPLRGILDLAAGRYPRFLFGGSLGDALPVFHFHEAHPAALEPYFRHLAENAYRTVDSRALEALVLRGVHPGPRSVALCFDDAWSSLWIVVVPLLQKYGLRAIAYVSPARISESPAPPRPQHLGGDLPPALESMDRTPPLFCTWSEIQAMDASGAVDVEAHGGAHAKIAAAPDVADFIRPGFRAHPHDLPLVDAPDGLRFPNAADLGAPLFAARSRLSDACRWIAPDAFADCVLRVREHGGPAFFDRPGWRSQLLSCAHRAAAAARRETEAQRDAAIADDLALGRDLLSAKLGREVRHMCFPWAVAGSAALRIAGDLGYRTAFSDRLGGARIVRPGDPPLRLMRLKHRLLFCLPGTPRLHFFSRRKPPGASRGLRLSDLAP